MAIEKGYIFRERDVFIDYPFDAAIVVDVAVGVDHRGDRPLAEVTVGEFETRRSGGGVAGSGQQGRAWLPPVPRHAAQSGAGRTVDDRRRPERGRRLPQPGLFLRAPVAGQCRRRARPSPPA